MPYSKLSTTRIAQAVGCHPNTVRLYEAQGLIPPVERSPKGYRLYTPRHLEQMRFAWLALNSPFPGSKLRVSLRSLSMLAAGADVQAALQAAYVHLDLVLAELAQAEAAADQVTRWRDGRSPEPLPQPLSIGQAAALLDASRDRLRNWEANGMLRVPRAANGFRSYGAVEIARLRIIRMLLTAGYSSMAILRMLLQLDAGHSADPRDLLNTPDPDEDIISVSDRWLTTLRDHEARARRLLALLNARLLTDP